MEGRQSIQTARDSFNTIAKETLSVSAKISSSSSKNMGNIQCGPPTVFDKDFSLEVQSQREQEFLCNGQTPEEDDEFLRVHQPDRPQRCLVEPKQVNKALVEQAEELIQRGNMRLVDRNLEDIQNNDDSITTDALSAFEVTSAIAPTTITSVSAATEIAGNGGRPQLLNEQTAWRPKIRGGNAFAVQHDMNTGIRNMLKDEVAGRRTVRIPDQSCKCLSPCIEDAEDPEYASLVQKHTSVLHLRMAPKCVDYLQEHLSRLLPDNAITRAIHDGITSTNLSPPRNRVIPLAPSSDDSSSRDDVNYGASCPPSSPVTLLATGSVFMDMAVTGSLGLANRQKSRAVVSPDRKRLKSPDHYQVVLNRRSGLPLAVCALKAASTGPPVVRIFATKRRVYGQRAAATTCQLGLNWSNSSSDALPLYTWAEIVTEGRYPGRVRYSIFLATGSDGRFEDSPSYCAVHETSGSPEIRVVGRTEGEKYHAGCAVLSLCTAEDAIDEEEDVFFRVSVARGIDPCLFVCFCAFVDELLEKTMRLQCQKTQEQFYRNGA